MSGEVRYRATRRGLSIRNWWYNDRYVAIHIFLHPADDSSAL